MWLNCIVIRPQNWSGVLCLIFCDKPQLKMREINPFPCVLNYFPRRFKALFPGHKHPIYSLQNGTSPAVKHHASPVPRTTAKFGTRNLVPCKVWIYHNLWALRKRSSKFTLSWTPLSFPSGIFPVKVSNSIWVQMFVNKSISPSSSSGIRAKFYGSSRKASRSLGTLSPYFFLN